MRRWACAILVGSLAACAESPRPREAQPAVEALPSVRVPSDRGGVEVWSWVVEDPEGTLGEVLAAYTSLALPLSDDATPGVWSANGLRLVAVPTSEVEGLRGKVRVAGPVQRQWVGEASAWTSIARGPDVRRPREVTLDTGSVRLDPGPLGLSARCWTVANVRPGRVEPRVRLELVPTHGEPGRGSPWPDQGGSGVFDRLRATLELDGRTAVLVVPEKPGKEWGKAPGGEAEVLGPRWAPLPTLGEEMMCALRPDGGDPEARVVLVIVATTPREYRLIGE